jgi:hypothetical protein
MSAFSKEFQDSTILWLKPSHLVAYLYTEHLKTFLTWFTWKLHSQERPILFISNFGTNFWGSWNMRISMMIALQNKGQWVSKFCAFGAN